MGERPNLGTDELFELFSWMPAKAVIKHISSSKTLSTLLSEPFFQYKQSINSSRFDGGFFVQPDTPSVAHDDLEFHVLPTDPHLDFGIPTKSVSFLQRHGRVSASSQGLILLHKIVSGKDSGVLICNPVTSSCAPLPVPNKIPGAQRFSVSGFLIECNPRNLNESPEASDFPNDYTVAAPVLVYDDSDPWCFAYRLAVYRNGKWDDGTCELEITKGRQLRLDTPVGIFRGPNMGLVIHYLCDSLPNAQRDPVYSEPYVVAYDVERKRLWRSFNLPKGAWIEDGDHSKLKIFKWSTTGETLGLVRTDERRLTVWVLEDYERVSWRRVQVAETIDDMGVPEEEGDVVGCCVVSGKELVFATQSWVYTYEMEGPDGGRLEVVGRNGCREAARVVFTPYANTFRPVCGRGLESTVVKF